ncbi:hypothetical protein ACHAW6_005153 [Cyclotella cf. meneghiniana]
MGRVWYLLLVGIDTFGGGAGSLLFQSTIPVPIEGRGSRTSGPAANRKTMMASISPKGQWSPWTKTLFSVRRPLVCLASRPRVPSLPRRRLPTVTFRFAPKGTTTCPSLSARQLFRTYSKHVDASSSRSNGDRSDPTAKRPTTKCDPYGLSGRSLSRVECQDLIATLEDGWRLMDTSDHPRNDTNAQRTGEAGVANSSDATIPSFLEKQFYHLAFYDASRFLSHVALLATNINHYPYLSMERVLVDDLNKFQSSVAESDNHGTDDDVGSSKITKKKKRKVKGWVFVSTVRCSTYRPPTKNNSADKIQVAVNDNMYYDKGLTYHDFHLAMSIDVEASREELKQFLLKYIH